MFEETNWHTIFLGNTEGYWYNIFSLMYQKLYLMTFIPGYIESLVNKAVNKMTDLKFIGAFLCVSHVVWMGIFVNSIKSCISNILSIGPSLKLHVILLDSFLGKDKVGVHGSIDLNPPGRADGKQVTHICRTTRRDLRCFPIAEMRMDLRITMRKTSSNGSVPPMTKLANSPIHP